MTKFARALNTLMILTLCGVLLAAFSHQILDLEDPCSLCFLQRAGMFGVACGALFNLRFGIRAEHYAICLFSAMAGSSVAIRQTLLHICPDFSTFGKPVLGLSLYVWSFIVFSCVIFAVGLLLFIFRKDKEPPQLNMLEKFAFLLVFLIATGNVISTYLLCGFGGCND